MKPISADTETDVQRIHYALLRSVTGGKKLQLTFDLIQTLRRLALADVRRRFPNASDEELQRRFIARLLPRDDVIKAYGFDPASDQ